VLSLLRIAREVVADAAEVLARKKRPARVLAKGTGDFVTEVDVLIERRIARALERRAADHNFLGEETGLVDRGAPWTWVCDPVDGTMNFIRGLPAHAVALACLGEDLHPVAAAVCIFPERRLYSAGRALGAFAGSRRLSAGRGSYDVGSVIGVQWLRGATELPYLCSLLASGARIRNLGCSVAQICGVAAGALDANVQEQGKIWDVAAPGLIAVEAGAEFTDWRGRPVFPFPDLSGTTHYPSVAALSAAHPKVLRALRQAADVSNA
jgi:myo-inositol-1(or 4)-monophosphatase